MLGTYDFRRAHAWLICCVLLSVGCSAERGPNVTPRDWTTRFDPTAVSAPGSPRNTATRCLRDCVDFPSAPIFDSEGAPVPAEAPQWFGGPDHYAGPGPCVLEPQLSERDDRPGALFPSNWLRPRFRFRPVGNEDVWEIRITAQQEQQPLVAYTSRTTWAMPRPIWEALATNVIATPITVTIRGLNRSQRGRPSGTRGTFMIAPVPATGKMVYWATTSSDVRPDTSKLVGFAVGDESVIDALTITQAGERGIRSAGGRELRGMYDDPHGVAAGAVQCIGCHVSTPDGDTVAFTDHWPWNNVLASVQQPSVGAAPSYLTPFAQLLIEQPWLGMQTFSARHFWPGDRVMISVYSPRNLPGAIGYSDGAPYPSRADRLVWIDLESQGSVSADPTRGDVQAQLNTSIAGELGRSFGVLALDGETRSVAAPAFSHDGSRIVYTSADVTQDGRISGNNREVDLHMVPYNERRGGAVTELAGAAQPGEAEYYPAFSADDRLIAYNHVAKLDNNPVYYRPDGEIYVIPSEGGEAVRLAANDPPSCGGQISPGVINSWAKWSPSATMLGGQDVEFAQSTTFYWLVFSSARAYDGQFELQRNQYSPQDTRASQLYVTGIVRDDSTGELQTYPAIYIWNQDPKTSNLTPAWDEFKIPDVPQISPD